MLMEIAHLLTRKQVMHFTVMQYSGIITEWTGTLALTSHVLLWRLIVGMRGEIRQTLGQNVDAHMPPV